MKGNIIVNQNTLTVEFALERLEELITDSYTPALFKGKPFTEHELPAWKDEIAKEIKNILPYLRCIVLK